MTAQGKYDGSRSLANPEQTATLALTTLIASGGNATEASRRLKQEHGLKVPRKLITRWRDEDPLRYEDMRKELAPRLEAKLVGDILDNAIVGSETERESIEETRANLHNTKDPVALSTVARNMKQVVAQSVDKGNVMRGRPTTIHATTNIDHLIDKLEDLGVLYREPVIEATVEPEETG